MRTPSCPEDEDESVEDHHHCIGVFGGVPCPALLVARLASAVYRDHNVKLRETLAVMDASNTVPDDQGMTSTKSRKSGYSNGVVEEIQWTDPLRAPLELTDKEKAGALAIGGMRNTADTAGRLSYSSEFGRKLGDAISGMVEEQHRQCTTKPEPV